jgi:hypothetical protein
MVFDIEKILSMYWEATLNESNKKVSYKKLTKMVIKMSKFYMNGKNLEMWTSYY